MWYWFADCYSWLFGLVICVSGRFGSGGFGRFGLPRSWVVRAVGDRCIGFGGFAGLLCGFGWVGVVGDFGFVVCVALVCFLRFVSGGFVSMILGSV